jgi:hypothetical protein
MLVSVFFVCFMMGLSFVPASATAEPPPDVTYQGQLLDAARDPVAGPVNMQIRIYEAPDGAAPALYVEDHGPVALDEGVFSLLLGQGTPVTGIFDPDLFEGESRWLEVWVNGERLDPRQPVSSVPFAFQTSNSSRLEGKGVSEIEAPRVFDANGTALGTLVTIGSDGAATSCFGTPEAPAGRLLTFFHRPSGLLFNTCLLDGQKVSASAAIGIYFTDAGCSGDAYGEAQIAGFAEVVLGRVFGGTGPVTRVEVESQAFPGTTGFPDTCNDFPSFFVDQIPLADVTAQVEFSFPLPAPLTIGSPAP